jgi:hypothetical protein
MAKKIDYIAATVVYQIGKRTVSKTVTAAREGRTLTDQQLFAELRDAAIREVSNGQDAND